MKLRSVILRDVILCDCIEQHNRVEHTMEWELGEYGY
jgi:hypothetical protein